LGGCVGVVTGCLLGMSCLLFMDTSKADRAKKAKKLQSIFASILEDGHNLVDAGKLVCAGCLLTVACNFMSDVCQTNKHGRTSHTLDAGRRQENIVESGASGRCRSGTCGREHCRTLY